MRTAPTARGFSLLEVLIVVALIGIVALATVPVLQSRAPTKLDAAAAEVRNMLRFALSEANRTGADVVVVASEPRRLSVYPLASGAPFLVPIKDPLTKAGLEIDLSAPPWSARIALTARFLYGPTPTAYKSLVIEPGGQLQVYDGAKLGPPQSGSGLLLTSGMLSATVAIDETTGRVSIP